MAKNSSMFDALVVWTKVLITIWIGAAFVALMVRGSIEIWKFIVG